MNKIKILFAVFIFMFQPYAGLAQDILTMHFIDAGEGDAILIQSEGESALVDTGSLLSGYKVLGYLESQGVRMIKYLILSHPHPDHIGGVFFILPKLNVENIYDNGQAIQDNDDLQYWYDILARDDKRYNILQKGDSLKLGSITLNILWPITTESGSYNENSLVISVNFNDRFQCLLAGDLDKTGENRLLKEGVSIKADILKIGHHGYEDATSEEFLKKVSPEVAIISIGRKRPSGKVLNLLAQSNVKIYRTDKNKDIVVKVNEKGNYLICLN